jgi:hypothetical protein
MDTSHRPKIAETVIHETARLREAEIGRRCEVLRNTIIEYSSLGDYSYLGENCEVADAVIGKFTAIANSVRIGAPNHPMERPSQHRFTYCPEYYEATATRDRDFFADRRSDKGDGRQRLLDRPCRHHPARRDGRRWRGHRRRRGRQPKRAALHHCGRRSGAAYSQEVSRGGRRATATYCVVELAR